MLNAIRLYHERGVWVEVTTLVIPDLNDSDEELTGIAEFLTDLDPAIPWRLSQYGVGSGYVRIFITTDRKCC